MPETYAAFSKATPLLESTNLPRSGFLGASCAAPATPGPGPSASALVSAASTDGGTVARAFELIALLEGRGVPSAGAGAGVGSDGAPSDVPMWRSYIAERPLDSFPSFKASVAPPGGYASDSTSDSEDEDDGASAGAGGLMGLTRESIIVDISVVENVESAVSAPLPAGTSTGRVFVTDAAAAPTSRVTFNNFVDDDDADGVEDSDDDGIEKDRAPTSDDGGGVSADGDGGVVTEVEAFSSE